MELSVFRSPFSVFRSPFSVLRYFFFAIRIPLYRFLPSLISSSRGLLAGQEKKQHPHSMQSKILAAPASSIRLFLTNDEKR